jgi:hypothetical protein
MKSVVVLYVLWLVATAMLVGAVVRSSQTPVGYYGSPRVTTPSYRTTVPRVMRPPSGYGYVRSQYRQRDDYYTLLRWVCCGVFAYSAVSAVKMKRAGWAWPFGALAVLFNPVAPIYLNRDTWHIIDVATIGVMVAAGIVFRPRKTVERAEKRSFRASP